MVSLYTNPDCWSKTMAALLSAADVVSWSTSHLPLLTSQVPLQMPGELSVTASSVEGNVRTRCYLLAIMSVIRAASAAVGDGSEEADGGSGIWCAPSVQPTVPITV